MEAGGRATLNTIREDMVYTYDGFDIDLLSFQANLMSTVPGTGAAAGNRPMPWRR